MPLPRLLPDSSVLACVMLACLPIAATAQVPTPARAAPGAGLSADAAAIDPDLLELDGGRLPADGLYALLRQAAAIHPVLGEAGARAERSDAEHAEARSALLPVVNLGLYRTIPITRSFQANADTLYEDARSVVRTDAVASAQQLLFDFGASTRRLRAASERRSAAEAAVEDTANGFVLRGIEAYYNVANYRALAALGERFLAGQHVLRRGVEEQIAGGVAATGDLARVDAIIAASEARLVYYRRLAANAETAYGQIFGAPPPAAVGLVATPGFDGLSKDAAIARALDAPQVRFAEAQMRAARYEARAARGEQLPRLQVRTDAGAYRFLETGDAYDVRAQVVLSQRFGGGLAARASAADAAASEAAFRHARIAGEVRRDTETAWNDAQMLRAQLEAVRASYAAERQARAVLFERFRYTRGTLTDLLDSGDRLMAAAETYLLTAGALDMARFALLARTGDLLAAARIDPHARDRP